MFGGFDFFVASFTTVILSRFILNLRRASTLAENNSGSMLDTNSTPPIIQSFGGSIAFAGEEEEEEDVDPILGDEDHDIQMNEEVGDNGEQHGSRQSAEVAPAISEEAA
ncbi:hypothetical protein C8Q72DRAFT_892172 [Fomitopsis betulina]|nr:hypothetical protein C8Q72DRAFT_892172 [Fomitopsis betulina]